MKKICNLASHTDAPHEPSCRRITGTTIGTGHTIGRTTMTTPVVVEPVGTTAGTTVKISISIVVTTLEEMHHHTTTTIDAAVEDRTTIEGGTTIDGMNTGIGSTIGIAAVVDLVVGLEGGTTTENLTDGAAAARSRSRDGSERTGIGRETITMMGLREVDGRRGTDTTVGWGERGRGLATGEVGNANATIEEEEPREEREEAALNRGLVVVNRSGTRWMVMMVDDDRGLSRRRGLGCLRNNGGWRRESSWRVNGWNETRRATRRRLDAMGITKNVNGKSTLGIYNLDKSVRRRCAIC